MLGKIGGGIKKLGKGLWGAIKGPLGTALGTGVGQLAHMSIFGGKLASLQGRNQRRMFEEQMPGTNPWEWTGSQPAAAELSKGAMEQQTGQYVGELGYDRGIKADKINAVGKLLGQGEDPDNIEQILETVYGQPIKVDPRGLAPRPGNLQRENLRHMIEKMTAEKKKYLAEQVKALEEAEMTGALRRKQEIENEVLQWLKDQGMHPSEADGWLRSLHSLGSEIQFLITGKHPREGGTSYIERLRRKFPNMGRNQ